MPRPLVALFVTPLIAIGMLMSGAAQAEQLRCTGGFAVEGDSRLAVLQKCGEPRLRDTVCLPVWQRGVYGTGPVPWVALSPGCEPVEEWLYDRGPGYLPATLRFRWGRVAGVLYGAEAR
jgi:hypothetical protein